MVAFQNDEIKKHDTYYSTAGVRPVVTLEAKTKSIDGEGTFESPYILD